ncbi:MAG TPA: DUF2007 domain-containing protein [Phenylobacterium sp.]|jgi:hypothetical protein|nr:DUF2007 domain-containing protein [Phenylobacterium sp.]
MIEILKTTDPVRLGLLRAVLEQAGVQVFVFEAASPWPGAFPARLMVPDADVELARHLIAQIEA